MKKNVKKIVAYLCLMFVSPCIFLAWIEKRVGEREEFFSFFAQLLSLIPGKIGSYFRVAYYSGTLQKCPHNIFIAYGSFFSHRNVVLEDNVNIGAYCVIGCVRIGKETMLASRVSVTSGKEQHITVGGKITSDLFLNVVTIGEKTWVGEGAIIIDDVGDNCMIAAGCVVTKKIPSDALVSGNPGRILKRLQ